MNKNQISYSVDTLISEQQIKTRITELGKDVNQFYKNTNKLLVVGLGVPIVFQAFINIGVTVQLFPVTGQTLPLVSSGGTSAWMNFIAIGIILSVSNSIKNENIDNPLFILSEDK